MSSSTDSKSSEPVNFINKEARLKCHIARDEFFKCVADSGVVFSLENSIPKQCKQHRRAFEQLCKKSWVRHFDISQDKELRLVQNLRKNINTSSSTATGGLSGKDQNQ